MIIVNGGSSAGKSGIVRCLQEVLPDPWLAFGVDSLITALPMKLHGSDRGIVLAADGSVSVGADFTALEAAWRHGIAATARAGGRVIIDDVFLGGAASQQRWQDVLGGLGVLWAGVRCDADIATGREIARGDRVRGQAASQAAIVHEGVRYSVEVDSSRTESLACARAIAAQVR